MAEHRIEIWDETVTEYAFDNALALTGPPKRRHSSVSDDPPCVPPHVAPMLPPGTRVYMDEAGAVRLCPALREPVVERRRIATAVRRTQREVAVHGHTELLWALLRLMDGQRTTCEIVAALPECRRGDAQQLLARLAAAEVVDISGHPWRRALHTATQKGVLPGGRLAEADLIAHTTSGDYRTYPGAPRFPVDTAVPARLAAFSALTRRRRSAMHFGGGPIARADFDALLTTACGVTEAIVSAGHPMTLRAYPSGGGLYAIEIYPVVFAVDGLQPAVYHYRAGESVLELVQPGQQRAAFVDIALAEATGSQRAFLNDCAAMICLVANFPRSERKYGQGGYRVLAAEAGHISATVILAATALGLKARPFGGVFDNMANRLLGLERDREQLLLSVLMGADMDEGRP